MKMLFRAASEAQLAALKWLRAWERSIVDGQVQHQERIIATMNQPKTSMTTNEQWHSAQMI